MRAVLATEVRRLTVQRVAPLEKVPEHLPPNCAAVRCDLLSFSGVPVTGEPGRDCLWKWFGRAGAPNVRHDWPGMQHVTAMQISAGCICNLFSNGQ